MSKKGGAPQNLTPWKPGQSGNPKGKPKGARDRATIVRQWIEAPSRHGQIVDEMVLSMIRKAWKKGDVAAFKELMDSAHGKLADKQQVKAEHEITVRGLSETAEFLSRVRAK